MENAHSVYAMYAYLFSLLCTFENECVMSFEREFVNIFLEIKTFCLYVKT